MVHAREDYNCIQDPDGLIPEDEPVFLLRAQDTNAPIIVYHWAALAEASGVSPDIVQLARDHALKMYAWQAQHGNKVPDLPE